MNPLDALRERSRHLATAVVVTLIFAAGFALGHQYSVSVAQSPFSPPPGADELFRPFWQVYNLILDSYVDPEGDSVEPAALVDGAIRGMVEALDDEFSGYMDAEEYPMINQDLEGEIDGIGVVIRTLNDTREIEVVSVMKDSPAARAGIQPGDIFAFVDGEDVRQMNQMELARLVRGPVGTTVRITMLRGDDLVDFTITRARIVVPMVESELLADGIGYVKLNQFGPQARGELDRAIDSLGGRDLDGLILDLRGNPGGLLSSAIEVGSAFVPQGAILVEDFGNGEQVFDSNGSYTGLDIPMVVLVDEASASASELIAGALQDHGVATIVGEITFGKGTVQTWQNLVNGGGVRLTVARWLTPDRHWIHGLGITPDIIVEWNPTDADSEDDPQLGAALDFLQSEISAQTQ